MHSHIENRCCRKWVRQQLACCAWLFCALAVAPCLAADPYLDMLEQEATKVERPSSDTSDNGNVVTDARADPRPAALPSRERFEALLRRQHVGTYSFYSKLPESRREEIFLDYGNGASMEALREKIIDRYLHR